MEDEAGTDVAGIYDGVGGVAGGEGVRGFLLRREYFDGKCSANHRLVMGGELNDFSGGGNNRLP